MSKPEKPPPPRDDERGPDPQPYDPGPYSSAKEPAGSRMPKGAKPTHRVCVLDKETSARGEVGVAWERDDGAISIKLNPGTVLSYVDSQHMLITLFPNDRK